MAAPVAEERFDWCGPAVPRRRKPLPRTLVEQVVPPRGHKVIPTGSGMLLIFIGLTIGLAAYNTVNNILFAALALLIASLIISGVLCWGNMSSARWRLEASKTFRVGEEGIATIVLENARQRFPLFSLHFGLESDATEAAPRLYLKSRLEPGEREDLVWRFKPERRMKTTIRVVDVVSSFPFGFLTKYLPGEAENAITVWPRRIPYTWQRSPAAPGALRGRSSNRKGESGELIGLRHYAKGDSVRAIHWKVSAKQGRLIVKQNATETQSLCSIVVDPSSFLWKSDEHFELMCSFAASLAEDLFLENKLSNCFIVGGPSVRVQRVADLEVFFDALAELQPSETPGDRSASFANNAIEIRPLHGGVVGAYINDVQVAQT